MRINIARVLSPMYHLEFSENVKIGETVTVEKRKLRQLKKSLKLYVSAQSEIRTILNKYHK